MTGTAYLLHFTRKYKHAGHYIGWTSDLEARLGEHRKGRGARLLQVIQQAGIEWVLARTWEGKKRWFERALKKRKFGPIHELCPLCRERGNADEHPFSTVELPIPTILLEGVPT